MANDQKKTKRVIEFIFFLVLILCVILILIEIYNNVVHELQGNLWMMFAQVL